MVGWGVCARCAAVRTYPEPSSAAKKVPTSPSRYGGNIRGAPLGIGVGFAAAPPPPPPPLSYAAAASGTSPASMYSGNDTPWRSASAMVDGPCFATACKHKSVNDGSASGSTCTAAVRASVKFAGCGACDPSCTTAATPPKLTAPTRDITVVWKKDGTGQLPCRCGDSHVLACTTTTTTPTTTTTTTMVTATTPATTR